MMQLSNQLDIPDKENVQRHSSTNYITTIGFGSVLNKTERETKPNKTIVCQFGPNPNPFFPPPVTFTNLLLTFKT